VLPVEVREGHRRGGGLRTPVHLLHHPYRRTGVSACCAAVPWALAGGRGQPLILRLAGEYPDSFEAVAVPDATCGGTPAQVAARFRRVTPGRSWRTGYGPRSMRAWRVERHGEPRGALTLRDLHVPEPGPDEIRVRVAGAGLGLPDVLMCRGVYPLTPPLPFTPGQELVGEVTAVGDEVEIPIGARIMAVTAFRGGHGGFAEEALVLAHTAFAVPDGLDDVDAAGFWIPHLTAWVALVERGRIARGEWLAVLGAAGSSGLAAVQLGRVLGARVIAVVSNDAKAELCRAAGAEATIDRTAGPVAPGLRDATGGHGVDLVFDPVGGVLAEDSARALARLGRFLAVGFASGAWPAIDVRTLVQANASLVGVIAAGYERAQLDEIHRRLSERIAQGELRSTVTTRIAFDELPDGLEQVAAGRLAGKAVLVVR
jgi:NADPH2:quinone reductase